VLEEAAKDGALPRETATPHLARIDAIKLREASELFIKVPVNDAYRIYLRKQTAQHPYIPDILHPVVPVWLEFSAICVMCLPR
jgi:hypothetical protein